MKTAALRPWHGFTLLAPVMHLDLPQLNALKAFEAAARHVSFTRAAEELCVTQISGTHWSCSRHSNSSVLLCAPPHLPALGAVIGPAFQHQLGARRAPRLGRCWGRWNDHR